MALHPRKIIRDAFRAVLLGQTAAGDRVFAMRMIPHRVKTMPAITVYALTEEVDPASVQSAPRELDRTVSIAIEAVVAAGANVDAADDQLDAIALQIETALHADDQQGKPDVIDTSWLVGTEMDVIAEGERNYGVVRLVYAARYYTFAPDPEATPIVDDFATADIQYDLNGSQDEADRARDKLTGLEE